MPAIAFGADALIADATEWVRGSSLYLEVSVNGAATGRIAHFDERDGILHASTTTLRALGFVLDGDEPRALASMPGVTVDYDRARQRVALGIPIDQLDLAVQELNRADQRSPAASTALGLLLNYDLYASAAEQGEKALSGTGELRFFGWAGVLRTAFSARHIDIDTGWRSESTRLASDWTFHFPQQAMTVSIGDGLTGNLDWTRPVHFGGLRIARDYSLQPYRITMPLPAFAGSAAAPSAVDLYVNGMRQYSGEIPAGPFQLTALPLINGSGQAQIVVTDAFGRAETLAFSFYSAPRLLARGLTDGSLELGHVRENFGLSSDDYAHDPFLSGTLRRGVDDSLTVEGHVESTRELANLGAGAYWQAGNAGVFSGSLAASRNDARGGRQWGAGYSYARGRFSVAARSVQASTGYTDLGARHGSPPVRKSQQATLGLDLGRQGSLGMTWLRQRYDADNDDRYLNINWFRSLLANTLSLGLGYNQNLEESEDRNLFLSLSYSFRRDLSVGLSMQHERDGSAAVIDAYRPVDDDGGFGWHAQARGGDDGRRGTQLDAIWRASHAELRAGYGAFDGTHQVWGDLNGSLVLVDGNLFASRRIDDAFAVVSTSGVAGVPVRLENRPIGETDAGGRLLIARLNAWQRNQLSIDPMDLPADQRIDRIELDAVPGARAGTVVRFGITAVRAASIFLLDPSGEPIALGTRVRIAGIAEAAMTGYDGMVYLEHLAQRNVLEIETPTGPCRVTFELPTGTGSVPNLGPFQCRVETP